MGCGYRHRWCNVLHFRTGKRFRVCVYTFMRLLATCVDATLSHFVLYLLSLTRFLRVLQEYYASHQLSSASQSAISWIGSLQICALFSGALVGGPLFDRYGAKVS